jgi:D-alanine-D-alanine ligase
MKVAVVHNSGREGVICRFRKPSPERYGKRTILRVAESLGAEGHTVALLEGDKSLLAELERFMPPDPVTGAPTGLVLNMAYGIQGESRYTHVPAMLELAGIPYTGSAPLGHAVALDKAVAKTLMIGAGVPTPGYALMEHGRSSLPELRFPLVVKPRHESTSYGLELADNRKQLRAAVDAVVARFEQAALVEEYIEGREVCVALLGNERLELLPPVELSFCDRAVRLVTYGDKYHRRPDEPEKLCPAPLTPRLAQRVRQLACATFRACQARDYGRVDIRIDRSGDPYVLELNSMASLGGGGSFVCAAEAAGYSFERLVNRIVEIASERYFGSRHRNASRPAVPAV